MYLMKNNMPLMTSEALAEIPMKQFQLLDFGILLGYKLVRVDDVIHDSWTMTIMKQLEIRHAQ